MNIYYTGGVFMMSDKMSCIVSSFFVSHIKSADFDLTLNFY